LAAIGCPKNGNWQVFLPFESKWKTVEIVFCRKAEKSEKTLDIPKGMLYNVKAV